jgi:hypothetical protein
VQQSSSDFILIRFCKKFKYKLLVHREFNVFYNATGDELYKKSKQHEIYSFGMLCTSLKKLTVNCSRGEAI